MPGASRTVLIRAPVDQVFRILTDYDRYQEFLPEVKSVRSSGRQGGEVLVHYEVNVVKTIRYTLKMHEEPPHRITWSFHDGEVMRDNRGSWTLVSKGPQETEATYQIELTLGPLVPRAIVNALVDSSLPKMLEAFKRRAESA
jgi:ribosome-associated toxin RatA of RatAB toxin-antitoxin module